MKIFLSDILSNFNFAFMQKQGYYRILELFGERPDNLMPLSKKLQDAGKSDVFLHNFCDFSLILLVILIVVLLFR